MTKYFSHSTVFLKVARIDSDQLLKRIIDCTLYSSNTFAANEKFSHRTPCEYARKRTRPFLFLGDVALCSATVSGNENKKKMKWEMIIHIFFQRTSAYHDHCK